MGNFFDSNTVMIWIWLAIFVISLMIEFATFDFVSIWFAVASLPSLIISLISPTSIVIQIFTFVLISVLLIIFTRPLLMKYFKRNVVSTNSESFIGKVAIVTKAINEYENGFVSFESQTWTAVSSENLVIGDKVRILAIEGNKFIVSKVN